MAEKTVLVRLKAEIGQYERDLKRAAASTSTLGRELTGAGKTARSDLDGIARGATGVGVALTAGFAVATHATMGFDQQLSELAAVSSATRGEMDQLRDSALEAGAKTVFSASEAATAQTELAKAGVSTADIMGGALTGALDLAAAGGLELGRAAEVAAGAMGTFDLAGRDVTHIADVLAAGANKSAADVDELAMAMSQSGLVADQYGLDLEDTVGVLALFAQNQLKGSDAGTSFKTMLQRLTPTSKEAADKMSELGIEMFDASGKFIGIEAAAEELKTGLSGLTQEQRNTALATIFGSDAVRAATILYEEGASGVGEWIRKVDDAGFASEVAATRMDNLSGDLEALRGSIETTLIQGGSQATGALRFMTQEATDAVNGFAAMPGPLQGVAVGLAGIGGAGALAVGGLAYLAPRFREVKQTLEGMGSAGQFASRNLGRVAVGLGVATTALALYSYAQSENAAEAAEATEQTRGFASAIREAGNAAAGIDTELESILTDTPALAEAMEATGTSVEELRRGLSGSDSEFETFKNGLLESAAGADLSKAALAQLIFGLDDLRGRATQGAEDAKTLNNVLGDTGDEAGDAAPPVGELATQLGLTADEASKAEQAVKDYQDALRAGVDPVFAMADALRGNRDAQKAYSDALAANADGVKDNNVSQQELEELLQEVASSALDVEVAASDLAFEMANGAITAEQFKQRLDRWVQTGMLTEEQAADLATQFGFTAYAADLIDGDRTARLYAEDHASGPIRQVNELLRSLQNRSVTARINLQISNPYARVPGFQLAAGGMVEHGPLYRAPGGPIYRALGGPSGSDTVPMWATPGEYVMRAGAVDHWGAGTFAAMNAGLTPPAFSGVAASESGATIVMNIDLGSGRRVLQPDARLGRDVSDALVGYARRGGLGSLRGMLGA